MGDPYRYFSMEARELTDALFDGIQDLRRGESVRAGVATMLRQAHTLKGAARVVRLVEIAELAHAFEGLIAPFRDTDEPVSPEPIAAALELLDAIRCQVAALRSQAGSDQEPVASTAAARRRPPVPVPRDGEVPPRPETHDQDRSAEVKTVRTDVADLDVLLGSIEVVDAHLATLRRVVALVDGTPGTAAGPAAQLDLPSAARTLAETVDRIDRDMTQVRKAAEQLRVAPASSMFADLDRAVRDVARAQGKQVVFRTEGGVARIDAHVLATVQVALHQLVRNAVAHGIETEAQRAGAGKPPVGTVTLKIARRGRDIAFLVRDDGQGIDLEAVRGIAEREGLIAAGAAAGRSGGSNQQLIDLLLAGGISTAATLTEVSGRGIGMDVVRDACSQLGGRITVDTQRGQGTTVEITTPLTLATLKVVTLDTGRTTTAVPFVFVRAVLRVRAGAITVTPEGAVLGHAGRAWPFLPLGQVLGGEGEGWSDDPWSVVLIGSGDEIAALGVKRVLDTSWITMRPLPQRMVDSPVVAGVWTDAGGGQRLLLDPAGLVVAARETRPHQVRARPRHGPILIVDDSLTTRMLEQSILESAGYRVVLATSAEEGLQVASRARPALCLVDVEMPGMDGFTFVEQTRDDPWLRTMPCILVTTRATPQDRARGARAGAKALIDKSTFDQADLLSRIEEFITAIPEPLASERTSTPVPGPSPEQRGRS